ncbi:hypothetical protein DENSPDRAFT_343394 [Dentipellis sp. KUC8613]|nr:hypothetical protein DENSPDRAFT_343394 [Dentipellis sp. KUC8613]
MLDSESGAGWQVRKKRKRSYSSSSSEHESDASTHDLARQIVLEELDLETRIRQRLQETIQSRITWALLLQESLDRDNTNTTSIQRQGANDFQAAALDALEALEQPCLPLFSRELLPLPGPSLRLPSTTSTPAPSSLPSLTPPTRPDTRRTRRERPQHPVRPLVKLLFLRNTALSPPALAKLACPDCARTDFPSVQGLLNHCRLGHAREFGSHDDCIQTCAVPVPPDEREFVLAHGTELAEASLPGLRRLFEIAVGSATAHTPAPTPPPADAGAAKEDEGKAQVQRTSTVLSRTLGHHIDTPALAPFLGRTAKRRCIQVHDENAPVDIMGLTTTLGHEQRKVKPHWRMAYHHRSAARPALDMEEATSDGAALRDAASEMGAQMPLDAAGSRFHILARVSVTDRSLWLPQNRRPPAHPEHTHRWMLSVDSPSYSLHITAFLAKMTVTCLSSPPPASLIEPLEITAPPFAATSTTDRPFLARVALTWVGAQNPVMEVEHWVELDALKSASPAVGDEQVLDVELDRTTELLPARPAANRLAPALWERSVTPKTPAEKPNPQGPASRGAGAVSGVQQHHDSPHQDPPFANLLRSLLPRFPLTLQDIKGRGVPQVPYKLVASSAQFSALVPGRRKAIEWGRARALQAAYEHARQGSPAEAACEKLSTANVFCWLRDQGLSLRAPPEKANPPTDRAAGSGDQSIGAAENSKPSPPAIASLRSDATVAFGFCPSCGCNLGTHAPLGAPGPRVCCVAPGPVPRLPLLDVRAFLADAVGEEQAAPGPLRKHSGSFAWSARDLARAADPEMVAAVRGAVTSLRLPAFSCRGRSGDAAGRPGDGRTDSPALDDAERVAPYAFLSLAVRAFVHELVQRGVGVLREDVARAQARGQKQARGGEEREEGGAKDGSVVAVVLAPAHIVRGIQASSREARALQAVVSTFGFGVRPRAQIAMTPAAGVFVKPESSDDGGAVLAPQFEHV